MKLTDQLTRLKDFIDHVISDKLLSGKEFFILLHIKRSHVEVTEIKGFDKHFNTKEEK